MIKRKNNYITNENKEYVHKENKKINEIQYYH